MKSVVSSLLPKETPVQLIIAHGAILKEITSVLESLALKYFEKQDISELVTFISDKESEADEIKFDFRKMLDQYIKVPFPKPTLIQAIHIQDDIIDMMEDVAKRMSMNSLDFTLDAEARQDFISLVREVQKIVAYLEDGIYELKAVLATAFSKRERQKEEKEIVKVEELESAIDELTVKLGKWTYSKKHEYNALDLIFFNELVILLARMGDKAENLAELLRTFTR